VDVELPDRAAGERCEPVAIDSEAFDDGIEQSVIDASAVVEQRAHMDERPRVGEIMSRMLDDELLEELERRWRERSPEIFERFAPGLSDEEIIATAAPLGLTLPEEVLRWFRWQNGTNFPVMLASAFESIDGTVERTEIHRKLDVPHEWLNVMDNQPYVFFDCGGDPPAPAAVWHYDVDRGLPTRPKFQSIGDMVALWIELIDSDQLLWDADGNDWWDVRDDASDELRELTTGAPLD
jgi:hypothetical protein